jgi:uncharacterized protein (TIGR03118 family)
MKSPHQYVPAALTTTLVAAALLLPVVSQAQVSATLPYNHFSVANLTTNATTGAANTDANLVNPWGISRSSGGPWWVSDNGTGLSTLYGGTGSVIPLVVTIPAAAQGNTGSPTGTIFNGTSEFALGQGKPALFLFSTEDGTISGWNPGVYGTKAKIAVNESESGASFKGLTAAEVNLPKFPNQTLLYAADFTLNQIEVFDSNFHHVRQIEKRLNGLTDLPTGYAPFNVQNLGGNIYVAYAKQGVGINEQDGDGLGEVRIFSPEGYLLLTLQTGQFMNAPWGMAIAPSDFGIYSHSILVANFGSGWIAAFNPVTGLFQDFLRDANGQLITIPGIWSIAPGNGGKAGSATSIFFAAGGAGEATGTLGTITATLNPHGNDQ